MAMNLEDLMGFTPSRVNVKSDLELGAVQLDIPGLDAEVVLSPVAAIDLIVGLVTSLQRLNAHAAEEDRQDLAAWLTRRMDKGK